MKELVIRDILKEKIIIIVRGIEREKLVPLARAVYDGGIRLMELTYSADGAVSDEDIAANIKLLCDNFKGTMHIGAGTVLTEKQVELTRDAGGEFIISPDTNPAVIRKTNELDLVSIPGALTPTEIQQAHLAGADFVKMFPITNMGPEYVKAVKAPLSHIRLLAVGGVSEKNMAEYAKAGACGFGVGSTIIKKELIDNNDFSAITELARKYTQAI